MKDYYETFDEMRAATKRAMAAQEPEISTSRVVAEPSGWFWLTLLAVGVVILWVML